MVKNSLLTKNNKTTKSIIIANINYKQMKSYILIHELAGSRIVGQCEDLKLQRLLTSLGFIKEQNDFFIKKVDTEQQRIHIIKNLMQNYQVLFADGQDWSPAQLILYYRDQGIIKGKIKIISWQNQHKYKIIEE